MRTVLLWTAAALLLAVPPAFSAPHARGKIRASADPSSFQVGGLGFTVPSKWIGEAPAAPARAGQWRVPPRGRTGEGGELVAFYFGPGKGGTAKDNIDDWIGTMFKAEGHPAAAEVKNREKGGAKISQVVVFGTYAEPVPIAGIPPVSRPDYGLIGTVIENAQGNVYWRLTGPEPLITANLPLFNQMIDSVKVQGK
jgi:hypothetical protein